MTDLKKELEQIEKWFEEMTDDEFDKVLTEAGFEIIKGESNYLFDIDNSTK